MPRPQRTRAYHNEHFDSSTWDLFRPRRGDVIITTSYKSGTTWMQQIVATLLFGHGPLPDRLEVLSPWVDLRFPEKAEKMAAIEAQTHRRFLKTHLPLDGLPFHDEAFYIHVGRDGRDVAWSLYNHWRNASDDWYALLNETPGRRGPALEPVRGAPRAFWQRWIASPGAAWDPDGHYPFLSISHWLYHAQSWWAHRSQPNIHFVHYDDLLADLPGEMARIAAFLGLSVSDDRLVAASERCTFSWMKAHATLVAPEVSRFLDGGPGRFINTGRNGRWQAQLGADDLARYSDIVARWLPPDCADWICSGTR